MGAVVSVAAHLRGCATPGQVLCSGSTRAALAGRVATRRCASLNRGGARPVEVFELVAPAPATEDTAQVVELSPSAVAWSTGNGTAPPGRALRREGAYWTIGFEGSLFRLPDSKGLHHLARLLAHPGVEFHVLQLVELDRNGGGPTDPGRLDLDGLAASSGGDAGEVLDAQARAAYAHRLEELRADAEEARSFNDPERAALATVEIEALTEQLASALGLGSRSRRAYANAERARVNVTKRIRAAMAAVGEHDRRLERHLRAAVRTGVFCSYEPDPESAGAWSV
jgi:hypothetical protein